MIKIITAVIILALWVWMGYEVYNAPLIDKDGNIKKKK